MKIPRVGVGQTQLSSDTGNRRINRQELSTTGEAMQVAGRTVGTVADSMYQKLNDARNYAENLTAKRKAMEGLAQITIDETNATNKSGGRKLGADTDFIEPREKIRTLREEVLSGFSDKAEKERFAMDYDLLSMNAEADIKKIYYKNVINQGQAEVQNMSDTAVNAFAVSGGDVDIEKQLGSIWDEAVKKGFYDSDVAYKKKAESMKDASQGLFLNDLSRNPKLADERLKNNFYKFDVKEAEVANNIYNKEIDKIQNSNEESLMQDYVNENINSTDVVKKLMNEGKIRPNFANSMINALNSTKKIGAKTSDKVFNDLAEDILNPDKKENDIRTNLLIKNAVGELEDKDFATLNTFFTTVNKETIDNHMPKKTWFQRLINNNKDKGLRQEIITRMFKQYMQKVNNGEEPGNAVREITSTALDSHLSEQLNKNNVNMVRMITPEGAELDVPEENIEKALKRGLKRARE